jgi:hypothetical protein
MRRYLKTKGLAGIARYSRAITTLSALAVVIAAVTIADAQFRPIPNYIGIGAGLQFRNDINNHLSGAAPIAPRIVSLPFAQLPAEQEGQEYWCSDCQPTNPCLGVGNGALALGAQGQWSCTSGAALPTGFPLTVDSSAGSHRIKSLAPNSATGDALSQGQSHLNDLIAASANYNMGANKLQNLGGGATNGDALSFGQAGAILNGLNLNSGSLSGLGAGTASGQALTFAQPGAQLTTNQPSITVTSTIETSGAGSPFTINAPASIVAGRALVLVLAVSNTATFSLPSGFTQVRTDAGTGWSQVLACKTATGSEPSSYSTAFTGSGTTSVGAILQLSNTNCAKLDVNNGGFTNSATGFTIPSLTTTQNNEFVVAGGSWGCSDVPGINVGQIFINNGGFGRLVVSGYSQNAASASPTPVLGPLNTNNCGPTPIVGQQVAFIPTTTAQSMPLITNQSGAQLATLNASVNQVLSVTAPPYNALGDGNTDDAAAIQQAIYDACGANPPTFPNTSSHKTVYLPRPQVCYMHSKPIRLPCPNLEFKGDLGTTLCQNYAGEAVIQEAWGVANLNYGTALVGTGNSLVSPGNVQVAESIDLARYVNGTGTNRLASKVTGSGFNIAFFMKATASNGQLFASKQAYPGTGSGAFSINYGAGNQVTANVNTAVGGVVSLTSCPGQTLGSVYEIELDWDKSTYRLWQGVPGGAATLCSSATSSNAIVQGPFEEIMLPPGGPHQFWPDGSSNNGSAFTGNIDSIRIKTTSVHTAAYTVPNAKFTADGSTYILENFDGSLDGTQLGYTFNGANVYSVVLNGSPGVTPPGGNYIHDMELCSKANGNIGNPDGLFTVWGNNSRYFNLSCSNAYYAQADLFDNDYLSRVENFQGFGGHVGLNVGAAFNDGVLFDNQIDGVDVACEVNQGGGGGDYEDFHTHCIDRGGLRYGWIQNQSQAHYTYPFVDQETTNANWTATFLLNAPAGPNLFDSGNVDTRNGAPYILQDNGGYGSTFLSFIFNTFGQDQPATSVIKFTNGSPVTPTLLINTLSPSGVPLSNQTGDPNVLSLGVGQTSVLQQLALQQVPTFDAGLNHLTVNAISDPAAPVISVIGATGSSSYGPYFVVCRDENGGITNVSPASNTIANGPATLTSTNYILISWTGNAACGTWDVLKGNTATGLTTGVAGNATSSKDLGQTTASYTAPVRNNTGDITYGSMMVSSGTTFANLPGTVVNGARFYCSDCDPPANPPVTCTHSGAKTGSFVDGLNNQWLCVP